MKYKSRNLRILCQNVNVTFCKTMYFIEKRNVSYKYRNYLREKGFDNILEDGLKKLVFAPEIIMKQGFVDACFVCNILHPCSVKAFMSEDLAGGLKDELFCI